MNAWGLFLTFGYKTEAVTMRRYLCTLFTPQKVHIEGFLREVIPVRFIIVNKG